MFKIESYKRGIILSTVFNVFNKGLVFFNGIAVVYFFGESLETDIFFFVYNSIIILTGFIMNTNGSVIIPESMRIRAQDGQNDSMTFINFFILLYGLLFVGLIMIISINPADFFAFISQFDHTQLNTHKTLLYLSLPLFGLASLITLLSDILTSYKFFTTSMVVGIINGLVSLLMIGLLYSHWGPVSAFAGLLAAYVFNFLLLIYLLRKNLGWIFRLSNRQVTSRIWKNIGFAQLGNLTSALSLYTPLYILSGHSTGVITALTFAQQISALPGSLITTQFSAVAGIKFNELYAEKKMDLVNATFLRSANILHFIMIPVGFIIYFFATDIIQVVLGFTPVNSNTSEYAATFLRYLGLLLPLIPINTLMARLFMASHKIKTSFIYQISFNTILITCLFIGVRQLGIIGYPLSMLAVYFLNLIGCYFLAKKHFPFLHYSQIAREIFVLLIINLLISAAVIYLLKITGLNTSLFILIVATLIYACLLLGVNQAFKLSEVITSQTTEMANKLKKLWN